MFLTSLTALHHNSITQVITADQRENELVLYSYVPYVSTNPFPVVILYDLNDLSKNIQYDNDLFIQCSSLILLSYKDKLFFFQ